MTSQNQQAFINFALSQNILQFGDFTLKSGRKSPYFFNAGLFYTGEQLQRLGEFYAQTLIDQKIEFDILFGPAYKGLPLATSTAIALQSQHQTNISVSFNRKEAKQHGEGGKLIGAPLSGKKVVIIDDVITAGTAFREAKQQIAEAGGILVGLIIALNRQEIGQNNLSAIQEIEQHEQIPVMNIICLDDIIDYLDSQQDQRSLQAIRAYREKYG
jgi:orotate phosphoribosyltransferase